MVYITVWNVILILAAFSIIISESCDHYDTDYNNQTPLLITPKTTHHTIHKAMTQAMLWDLVTRAR